MKRCSDLFLAFLLLNIFFMPMIIIGMIIKLTSRGPILYWSIRVGKNNSKFNMPKFRTMKINTPEVATHLLNDPNTYITIFGRFLRRTSLDELPQLFSILRGEMSFVGPRPALFNQYDLITQRNIYGISRIAPGLTGWAQINGRDELTINDKVKLDKYYLDNMNFLLDVKILLFTFFIVLRSKGVLH